MFRPTTKYNISYTKIKINKESESMKKYTEMTRDEIAEIIRRGGDKKTRLNKEVAEYLHSLNLSARALDVIASTDINTMAEAFAGLMTAEDVEEEIRDQYPESEDWEIK